MCQFLFIVLKVCFFDDVHLEAEIGYINIYTYIDNIKMSYLCVCFQMDIIKDTDRL